jgi:hypothetical protein
VQQEDRKLGGEGGAHQELCALGRRRALGVGAGLRINWFLVHVLPGARWGGREGGLVRRGVDVTWLGAVCVGAITTASIAAALWILEIPTLIYLFGHI